MRSCLRSCAGAKLTEEFPTLLSRRPRQLASTGSAPGAGSAGRLTRRNALAEDKSGEPLHFAAQIDLAEAARATGGAPLPAKGSLAFFIGREGP